MRVTFELMAVAALTLHRCPAMVMETSLAGLAVSKVPNTCANK